MNMINRNTTWSVPQVLAVVAIAAFVSIPWLVGMVDIGLFVSSVVDA